MTTSPEYEAARAVAAATREYDKAVIAYRGRWIGDAEFIAAQQVWVESGRVFDAAFRAEAGWDAPAAS